MALIVHLRISPQATGRACTPRAERLAAVGRIQKRSERWVLENTNFAKLMMSSPSSSLSACYHCG